MLSPEETVVIVLGKGGPLILGRSSTLLGILLLATPLSGFSLSHTGASPAPTRTRLAYETSSSDTLYVVSHVRRMIQDTYSTLRSTATARVSNTGVGLDAFTYCDGGAGELCDGGDPDRGACPSGASCHGTEEFYLRELSEAVEAYPSSKFILGQAVYALTKFHQTTRALVMAEQCQAESWWCDMLMGYVLQAQGRAGEAEPFLRRAMDVAPIPERCAFGDGLWLLGEWSQERGGIAHLPPGREETVDMPCLDRLEVSDTLFWLGDPLYSVEGNERWVEHMARAIGIYLYEEIRDVVRGKPVPPEYKELDWAMRIRRGIWDSYRTQPGRQGRVYWTSQEKAPYHFLPDVAPGDFSSPTWNVEGDLFDEGFKPAFSPFFSIPTQVVRFRVADSMRILAAGALKGTPLEEAAGISAQFILTDKPGSFPLFLTGNAFRANAIFLGQAPARDYVVGLEVLSGDGVGWHREFIHSLAPTGPELSDLLLYQPREGVKADSLLQAAGLMLSSHIVSRDQGLGVFWEVYGAEPGTGLAFDLSLREEADGVMGRLSRFVPGGGQAAYGPVRWTEEATGPTHATSLNLELGNLDAGDYVLILKVRWPGQEEMERRRQVHVG